jgi:5-methylcytosine-specific restriction enzyme subunit McrC
LFARVLAHGTQHLIRRGLDRGYLSDEEETPRLRGRLKLTESLPLLRNKRGRLVCEFDDLEHNVLHNRILKSTIDDLLHAEGVDKRLRDQLHQQALALRHIDPIPITTNLFRRVQLHRNNRFYQFLLNVCELIHDSKLPEQNDGKTRFRDFIRDPDRMPYLFQHFIRNFYAREQKQFRVGSVQLKWTTTGSEEDAVAVLPIMQTDVSLWSEQRRVIVECKFYREAFSSRFDQKKLHADNVYQLYCYLDNAQDSSDWRGAEGILLYPAVDHDFDYRFVLGGHVIRVCSVDLNRPWLSIHERLLQVVGVPSISEQRSASLGG